MTFILAPKSKSKSEHSNLFKKKRKTAKANKQAEQIRNKNDIKSNQFRRFCGL